MLAGGLVLVAAGLRPALSSLPMGARVLTQQTIIPRLNMYLPLCGALAVTSAIFLVKRHALSLESARMYKAGVGSTVLVGLMSLYVGAVLDKEIGGWGLKVQADGSTAQVSFAEPAAPEDHRAQVWRSWGALNAGRTLFAVLAFSCFIAANLQARVLERER